MSHADARRYRRSPHLLLRWRDDDPILLHADTLSEFRVDAEVVGVLARLASWSTVDDLRAAGATITPEGLESLCRAGILDGDDAPEPPGGWEPFELAVHRRTARAGVPCPPASEPAVTAPDVRGRALSLPDPAALDGGLGDVLVARRTRREYGDRPLALGELSTLLHHAAGIARNGSPGDGRRRPFASAGARSELEIYVVVNDVDGLAPGAWHYAPLGHELRPVRDRDAHQRRLCTEVHDATARQLSRDPPAIVLVTAVFERMAARYGHLALSLIYKDVGCLMQTLYLVATAQGLAPCAVGGGDEAANSRWLGLDPLVESQVGCFLVGPGAAAR